MCARARARPLGPRACCVFYNRISVNASVCACGSGPWWAPVTCIRYKPQCSVPAPKVSTESTQTHPVQRPHRGGSDSRHSPDCCFASPVCSARLIQKRTIERPLGHRIKSHCLTCLPPPVAACTSMRVRFWGFRRISSRSSGHCTMLRSFVTTCPDSACTNGLNLSHPHDAGKGDPSRPVMIHH